MAKPLLNVQIEVASGQTIDYSTEESPWATEVRVNRKGDLQIYANHTQRVFHPAGEWRSYAVRPAAPARPVIARPVD
jgi:RecB family exonuclease